MDIEDPARRDAPEPLRTAADTRVKPFGFLRNGWRKARRSRVLGFMQRRRAEKTIDPVIAWAAADLFAAELTPGGRLWLRLHRAFAEAVLRTYPGGLGSPDAPRRSVAPDLAGCLVGQIGQLHYPGYRLLVRINPEAGTPEMEDGTLIGEDVEIAVEFDSLDGTDELVVRARVDRHGHLGDRVRFGRRISATHRSRARRDTYTEAHDPQARCVDLLVYLLRQAEQHRALIRNPDTAESVRIESLRSPDPESPVLVLPKADGLEWQIGGAKPAPIPVEPKPAAAEPTAPSVSPRTGLFDPEPARTRSAEKTASPEKAAEPVPEGKTEIRLYDPAALERMIDSDDEEDEFKSSGFGGDASTSQNAALKKVAARGPRRWLEHAAAPMLAALDDLDGRAPHFVGVTAMIRAQVQASINTGTPLRLPPTLILDEPGTGKTWYLSRLAAALGLPFASLTMAGITLADTIQGNNPSWRNASPGLVSKLLVNEQLANPLIFIDEFDKPGSPTSTWGNPYGPYYDALEPINAGRFVDEFLGLAFDASHILWVFAANALDPIPTPIRTRLTVLTIPKMTLAHRRIVAQSIYRDCNARLKGWYAPELSAETLAAIAIRTPRDMRKILDAALVQAGADNRRTVTPVDVALALATVSAEDARGYGFTADRTVN